PARLHPTLPLYPIRCSSDLGLPDHRREIFLIGELGDRFHQITVGFALAGDHLADARNGVEGPRLVGLVEERHLDLREFEAKETRSEEHTSELQSREKLVCRL